MIKDINVDNPLGKSDHSVIIFNFSGYSKSKDEKERLDFNKADFSEMRSKLSIDWEELMRGKNIEEQWKMFTYRLNMAIKDCIPIKKSSKNRYSHKSGIQLSRKLKSKMKRKARLWRQYRDKGDPKVYEQYKRVRNQVRRFSREAVKKYEQDIAYAAKDNPKRFWAYVKSRTKTKSSISDLYKDETKTELTVSDGEKADVLGKFFSSVFTVEPDDELPDIQPKDVPFNNQIDFNVTTVKKKLDELNISKSPGPDKLSPRVLKELSDVLALPVYIIFRNSVDTGLIPQEWKSANITAIFKKGDKKDSCNYRPVSLTCILCKLLEKIIREKMVNHMKRYDLFSDKQFGFISGRSTVLQLLAVLEKWTVILDRGGSVDVVYCDYMKAFDKVSHRRLIHKLDIYKFGNTYTRWISNFLAERRQKVIVNGCESRWQPVTSGIPQGSVLGPMLFVLFINDITENIKNDSQLYLYADDTKIFREIVTDYDRELLQEDIYSMSEWSDKWLLRFHPDKCKTMTIDNKTTPNREYKLKPDLPNMAKSSAEKDIGVIIDEKLTFSQHLSEKVNKANSVLGAMRRSFEFMDTDTFKKLYTALVRPHIEYAHQIWCPHKKKDILTLENVQRRATKMVPGLSNLSYEDRLRKLKLPTLSYRRLRGDMIECYKLLNNKYYFNEEDILRLNHGSSTRGNSMKLCKFRARLDIRKFSFSNRVVNIWNSLPDCVITAGTIFTFESRLDRYWKNQELVYNYNAILQTGTYKTLNPTQEELVSEADGLLPEII